MCRCSNKPWVPSVPELYMSLQNTWITEKPKDTPLKWITKQKTKDTSSTIFCVRSSHWKWTNPSSAWNKSNYFKKCSGRQAFKIPGIIFTIIQYSTIPYPNNSNKPFSCIRNNLFSLEKHFTSTELQHNFL